MAKNLVDCIAQIKTTVSAVPGLTASTQTVIETLASAPEVMVYPARGTITIGTALKKGLHTISCGVYVPNDDYPRYHNTLVASIEAVATALNTDPTLSGTCDTIVDMSYTYGSSQYGGYTVWGVTFNIEVKIQ